MRKTSVPEMVRKYHEEVVPQRPRPYAVLSNSRAVPAEDVIDVLARDAATITEWKWPYIVWPGGYHLLYRTEDGGLLCPDCATKEIKLTWGEEDELDPQWKIVEAFVYWEQPKGEEQLKCDHCGTAFVPECWEPESLANSLMEERIHRARENQKGNVT